MVYLVRTSKFTGNWENGWKILGDMVKYIGQNYDQVKDSYLMTNIAGPTDQVHWILAFDSLAAEEAFAIKVFQDPKYLESMGNLSGLLTAPIDRLYRRET
jgi:hypothetical protein